MSETVKIISNFETKFIFTIHCELSGKSKQILKFHFPENERAEFRTECDWLLYFCLYRLGINVRNIVEAELGPELFATVTLLISKNSQKLRLGTCDCKCPEDVIRAIFTYEKVRIPRQFLSELNLEHIFLYSKGTDLHVSEVISY